MINLAIVGCGSEAHSHVEILQQIPDCNVIALVSQTESHREEFQQKYYPHARGYPHIDDLLADPPDELHGVLLLTPHALHYPESNAALERGLHVLTEKPMVTATPEAHELWRLATDRNLVLSVAFQAPFSAAFQTLKHLRDRDEIGRPQIVEGWIAQDWLTSARGTWRQDPTLSGGGQLYDSGSHVINAILWLMDEPVTEVSAMIDNRGGPVDVNGVAILRFASGAMASLAIGGDSVGWDARIMLQTDRWCLHTDPHGRFIETRQKREDAPAIELLRDDTPAAFTPHRNFINAILDREDLQLTPRHGVILSTVMDALYESSNRQTIIKPPLVPKTPEPAHV
jgi:predicted dehydrogenase